MNDMMQPGSPTPRKSSGIVLVILVIVIILVVVLTFGMKKRDSNYIPVPTGTTSQGTVSQGTPSNSDVQAIDSLNAELDKQQFEGTSSVLQ